MSLMEVALGLVRRFVAAQILDVCCGHRFALFGGMHEIRTVDGVFSAG